MAPSYLSNKPFYKHYSGFSISTSQLMGELTAVIFIMMLRISPGL